METGYKGTLKLVRTAHETPRIRNHEQAVEGRLLDIPRVGEPLRFWSEPSRYITTSTVVSIAWDEEGFKAETLNSVYSLTLDLDAAQLTKLRAASDSGEKLLPPPDTIALALAVESAS